MTRNNEADDEEQRIEAPFDSYEAYNRRRQIRDDPRFGERVSGTEVTEAAEDDGWQVPSEFGELPTPEEAELGELCQLPTESDDDPEGITVGELAGANEVQKLIEGMMPDDS